ncbi:MAG TPA: hypothetical protein VG755_13775 [Nannocystaceae bacterium]|nr:hypothetical protein [Nannocystaceae bacterium]
MMRRVALALALLVACQNDGRSAGYHAPNIALGGGDLALVWLRNNPGAEELMFVRADPQTAKVRGEVRSLSKRARGSDPPLLAWDGERWRVVWTHESGIWTITVDQRGRVRGEQRIAEGKARLCPQLVANGSELLLAWRDEQATHIVKLRGASATMTDVVELESAELSPCALAWNGHELGFAWAVASADPAQGLGLMTLTADGKVLARRSLPTRASSALAIAAEQGGWAIAAASSEARGFDLVRLDTTLADRSVTHAPGDTGFVRGVGLASAPRSLSIWSTVPAQSDRVGTIWFAAPREDGAIVPQQIGEAGHGRKVVNTTAVRDTFALTWAENRNGSTINWAVLRRRGSEDHYDVSSELVSSQ